jgi:predicted GIY-YIG superfamily endonuclease
MYKRPMKSEYRAGSLYVLTHPSNPNLYKVGVTVVDPKKRLAQHNTQLDKAAGRVVRETGQKWELKTVIEALSVAKGSVWGGGISRPSAPRP